MYNDGNSLAINFLRIGVPFAAYFLGILIRKIALPGKDSPSLRHQFLLGVPVSLVIVSPLLTIFSANLNNMSTYLLTVGIIMEHGMLVTETAVKQIQAVRNQDGFPPGLFATGQEHKMSRIR